MTELAVGDELGPFRLEELLGEGGMGLVFRARRDGETVALKVMKVDLSGDETLQRRFVHEARAAAEVRDANLVPIVDAGDIGGRPYVAFAFVDGPTLERRLRDEGPLAVDELVRVASDVASALDALHAAGLIHRDVKSGNVMIAADGRALLTDLGLVKGREYTALTKLGQVMGTIEYVAPELIRGEPATPATDVYALGCTVFECAAGQTPFGDKRMFQVGLAHLGEEPPDPGAGRDDWPSGLSAAVLRALAKEPAERPASAGAYARLLREAAA
jgi:serine/threonine-protein kinase